MEKHILYVVQVVCPFLVLHITGSEVKNLKRIGRFQLKRYAMFALLLWGKRAYGKLA